MNKCERHLKIGLDYHGVINSNQEYFCKFCNEAIKRGHQIHILTGGPRAIVAKQLCKAHVQYTNLFTIVDYYRQKGQAVCMPDGEWFVDEELWNRAKAIYCQTHKIDIQIDDSLVYGEYFKTPYCLYNANRQICTILATGKEIALNEICPLDTLIQLEKNCP